MTQLNLSSCYLQNHHCQITMVQKSQESKQKYVHSRRSLIHWLRTPRFVCVHGKVNDSMSQNDLVLSHSAPPTRLRHSHNSSPFSPLPTAAVFSVRAKDSAEFWSFFISLSFQRPNMFVLRRRFILQKRPETGQRAAIAAINHAMPFTAQTPPPSRDSPFRPDSPTWPPDSPLLTSLPSSSES